VAVAVPPAAALTMRAAVLVAPRTIEIRELALPEPGPGQVRIRLEGCGVCASNVPAWEGRPWFKYPWEPGALGHEGWGVVDALGPAVETLEVGDRVAALSYHAFAEYDLADADAVVRLPESLAGVPMPGEPLGCAVNVFRRSDIRAGQTVAVLGVGFLGALLVRMAADIGARVIAISRRGSALGLACQFGAEEAVSIADHAQVLETVGRMTDGQGCDRVIEVTGKQVPLDLADELTRIRGRLVIAGYHQDGPRQVNMQQWNWKGLDVINAHERDQAVYVEGIEQAVEAVAAGRLDPTPLYTHRFNLEGLSEAIRLAAERPDGFVKALVMMNHEV
jgi:threonine dehydrogenase-like Zn-dependent dehydrogenase